MQQNNNNTQQQRQQRYIVNWDCSNQNKRYTIQEKQFIKQCYENGINPISIAKQLKRGLWAIEVQIMYLKNNHRNNHRAPPTTFYPRNRSVGFYGSHGSQTQHLKKQKQKQKQKKQAPQQQETENWGNNIKQTGKINRKFTGLETKIIKTKSNEMEAHIYQLLGINK